MNCSIIYYRYQVLCIIQKLNSKFQSSKVPSFKVSRFQVSKIPRLQDSKISKFQTFKLLKAQSFKISRFQDSTIPRFQDSPNSICQIPILSNSVCPRMIMVYWTFNSNFVYSNSQIRVHRGSKNPKIVNVEVFGTWIRLVPQEAE